MSTRGRSEAPSGARALGEAPQVTPEVRPPSSTPERPQRPQARVVRSNTEGPSDESGEPIVELRVVGPGRKERGYRDRIAALDAEVERHAAELEAARLIERGTHRLVDRVETALERERQQSRRVLVAMGSLQRDNELLQEQLSAAQAKLNRLAAPSPRRSFLARLFGSGPRA